MGLRLDRLNRTNSSGVAFQRLWQRNCEAHEAANADLQSQIDAIAAAQAAAAAAQATANTANTNAATAQSTANTVTINDKITASWTVPAGVVSAADAGSNVTITVAAHTRMYGDGSQVSVSGHTFTGKAYATDYGIYYDDLTASDTTPPYQITTNLTRAQNAFAPGRHRVAVVTTPASGSPPTTGGSTPPGGGGDTDPYDKYSTL